MTTIERTPTDESDPQSCCCGAATPCVDSQGRLPLSHVQYIADAAIYPEFRMLAQEVLDRRAAEVTPGST